MFEVGFANLLKDATSRPPSYTRKIFVKASITHILETAPYKFFQQKLIFHCTQHICSEFHGNSQQVALYLGAGDLQDCETHSEIAPPQVLAYHKASSQQSSPHCYALPVHHFTLFNILYIVIYHMYKEQILASY